MAGIEEAAAAFETVLGGTPSRASGPSSGEVSSRPEVLFDEAGFLENPEEAAGGDDKPLRARKKDVEVPDEDILANDEEEEEDNGEGGEEEEEDNGEGGEEDEDEELLSREFELMVDGEEVKVPLRDILKGYTDGETFNRRMGELQETAVNMRAFAEDLQAKKVKAVEIYDEALAVMQRVIPAQPDWDKLFAEDPAKARALQKQYEGFQEEVNKVKADRDRVRSQIAAETQAEEAEFARTEYVKFARAAKWANQKEQVKDIESMRRTALSVGMTEEEIGRIFDSRYLTILRKASKYDRMIASKPKPVAKTGSKPNGAAGNRSRTVSKGSTQAQRRLSQTGSVQDAAMVFEDILRGRRK